MKIKLPIGTVAVIVLLAVLLTFQITFLSVNNKYSQKLAEITAQTNAYRKLANVDEIARSLYVGEIDERKLDGLDNNGLYARSRRQILDLYDGRVF